MRGGTHDPAACWDALRKWLRKKAQAVLIPRLQALAEEQGFAVKNVTIRASRTRWASCSPRGTISLSLRLLFLPQDLVDYVLLHELCHTKQPNHSQAFWQLVARHDPDYREKVQRLRKIWVPDL
ncbi:MAG: M48 family metallopeptidase [Thermoleophilia bacterium]|nr:M48 family metallopeptidase [Thermoleophilia bacterium]